MHIQRVLPFCLVLACNPGPAVDPGDAPQASCLRRTAALALDTGTGTLLGTLELPAHCPPFPLALIHAGSGPTDRDGDSAISGRNDSLKLLAEALAARGIASVRYDKRGIAGSAAAAPGSERELRVSTYVDDAGRWLELLGQDPRFGGLFVVGHSAGSLIGMLAARARPGTRLVSIAGPGRPAGVVLREQLSRQLSGPLLDRSNQIIAELEAGREVAAVPPELAPLFRPSVQPYLIDWFRHDPARIIAELDAAPLVVQGTTDVQVSVADAHLLAAAWPDAELVLIEGMNHVLKEVSGDAAAQQPSYANPTLPLHPKLTDPVAAFITRGK